MQRSTGRIYTTHAGSLPGRRAVPDMVARQRPAGLDVISDGEQSKTRFSTCIGERLSGFGPRPGRDPLGVFPGRDRRGAQRRGRRSLPGRPRPSGRGWLTGAGNVSPMTCSTGCRLMPCGRSSS
jgi:hypothetical protein